MSEPRKTKFKPWEERLIDSCLIIKRMFHVECWGEDMADAHHNGMPTTVNDVVHMVCVCLCARALFKCMCKILCMTTAAEVGILPASMFCSLTKHLGNLKNCAKWITQCTVHMLLSTTHFQQWRWTRDTFPGPSLSVDQTWTCSSKVLIGGSPFFYGRRFYTAVRAL